MTALPFLQLLVLQSSQSQIHGIFHQIQSSPVNKNTVLSLLPDAFNVQPHNFRLSMTTISVNLINL